MPRSLGRKRSVFGTTDAPMAASVVQVARAMPRRHAGETRENALESTRSFSFPAGRIHRRPITEQQATQGVAAPQDRLWDQGKDTFIL
jgi:hypothetical protein